MIQELKIRNIALIRDLTVHFHRGMHVLSGETGAGKSIVVDAVNLVLGGRADRNLIRSGSETASVEADFDIHGNEAVRALLEREAVEWDGRTVTLFREISVSGKNVCRICGVMTTVSLLKELAALLMDVHGQHEHQFLSDPQMHMSFLDGSGGEDHRLLLERTAGSCRAFLENHRAYAALVKKNESKQRRVAELEEALSVLHAAKLKPGEEDQLTEECARLRNAEKIAGALREAQRALSGEDGSVGSLENIRSASREIASVDKYGEEFRSLAQRSESTFYELQEIAFELNRLLERTEADPDRLLKTEERLDLIRRLERKYGPDIAAVLETQNALEKEYEELCSLDDRVEETAAEHKRLLAVYRGDARELSASRKQLAAGFSAKMTEELHTLGMERTEFQVRFAEKTDPKPKMPRECGDDELEFMIAPNPGEPLKPLAQIASGGELSRLMLALKTMESRRKGVDCMVFDEIDTGISGRVAQAVAEKMHAISRERQVISVTHLPQIAAYADYQYLVRKAVEGERTFTSVTELDEAGRVSEIARMISGAGGIDAETERYAAQMIASGKKKQDG